MTRFICVDGKDTTRNEHTHDVSGYVLRVCSLVKAMMRHLDVYRCIHEIVMWFFFSLCIYMALLGFLFSSRWRRSKVYFGFVWCVCMCKSAFFNSDLLRVYKLLLSADFILLCENMNVIHIWISTSLLYSLYSLNRVYIYTKEFLDVRDIWLYFIFLHSSALCNDICKKQCISLSIGLFAYYFGWTIKLAQFWNTMNILSFACETTHNSFIFCISLRNSFCFECKTFEKYICAYLFDDTFLSFSLKLIWHF